MGTSRRTSQICQFWAILLQKSSSSYFSERWGCSVLERMTLIWKILLCDTFMLLLAAGMLTHCKRSDAHSDMSVGGIFLFLWKPKANTVNLFTLLSAVKKAINYLSHAFPGGNSVDCNSAQIYNQWKNLIYSRNISYIYSYLFKGSAESGL